MTGFGIISRILFLIDELDRCLPEYQIKVLEAIYHLLDIPNLIVVIAIDRNQLEYSIRNKSGDHLNVLGYLSKFIDYQVDLPKDSDNELLMTFDCYYSELVKHEDDMVYKEFFSRDRTRNYSTQKVHFNKSEFYKFLKKIEGTKIEIAVNYLLNADEHGRMAKRFLMNFINAFIPIRNIEVAELIDYFGEDEDFLNYSYDGAMAYPYSINTAIGKIKNLNF